MKLMLCSLIVPAFIVLTEFGIITMDDHHDHNHYQSRQLWRRAVHRIQKILHLSWTAEEYFQQTTYAETKAHMHLRNTAQVAIINNDMTYRPPSGRINITSFFTLDEKSLFELLKEEYSTELERLKTAYSIPGKRDPSITTPSPSQVLYGKEYDEIDRTLVGIRALRWIRAEAYETFVGSQPAAVRLSRKSFSWICKLFKDGLIDYTNQNDFYTLITSMIINDLGKSPSLAEEYAKQTNTNISNVNHDMILYQTLKTAQTSPNDNLIPSLATLKPWYRRELFIGIKLGAEFNFGQLAQAENVPACLSGLKEMDGLQHAFEMRFMEQLLDIAGAAGHIDHTCAKKLIEPIFDSYQNVYEIAIKIIHGDYGLREGYDVILIKRLQLLKRAGWGPSHDLDVKNPRDRALMRLLCIGGAADTQTAQLYQNTFENLPEPVLESLIKGLNVDGSIEEPAIQPTYIPAMCALAVSVHAQDSEEQKSAGLAAVLTYLSRVLTFTPEQREKLHKGVTVVERDVRTVLQGVIKSDAFKQDPMKALENLAVPSDEIAKMAEGYDWVFDDADFSNADESSK